jgi:hypothetical protein
MGAVARGRAGVVKHILFLFGIRHILALYCCTQKRLSKNRQLINVLILIDPGLLQVSEPWIFISKGYVVDLENAAGVGPAIKRVLAQFWLGYKS